ncbi:JmjC domain-containing protein [Thalassotalea sp. PLHSN55]|uniref:JmjC domain-containing protein n=1 Tax=Thalassotalea sp. PLHSN55 TaxID=3435888 RepID=UPI003F88023D
MYQINWGDITPEIFLKKYWQKKPLFIKGAFQNFQDPIEANELAGLAMEEHIESRIISQNSQAQWQVDHGPFDDFSQYGEQNWTLLVQAVNHWSRQTNQLLAPFNFLPSWRIDDVMVSFSTPNGGVGPHLDQYDVFIIQGEGKRHWRVGLPDAKLAEKTPHPDLKQVDDFVAEIDVVTSQGDLLYIPPNHPHDGNSIENSINFSIGFQAPNAQDLISAFADEMLDKNLGIQRFGDQGRTIATASENIENADLAALTQFFLSQISNSNRFEQFLASYLTKSHHGLELLIPTTPITDQQLLDIIDEDIDFVPVSGIKAAMVPQLENPLIINGDEFPVCQQTQALAKLLAQKSPLTNKMLKSFQDCLKNRQLLTSILNKGYWYIE